MARSHLGLAAMAIDFFETDIDITRQATGSYVNGRYVEGVSADATIKGTCHAIKDETRPNLPEGVRHTAMRMLHTRETILLDPKADPTKILVTYDGIQYQVLMLRNRDEGGFYKAYLGLYDETARSRRQA